MTNLGMFVYPWDVVNDARKFVNEYVDLGCNMLAINAVYHKCSVLDSGLQRVFERTNAGTSFAFHPNKYGRIKPQMEIDLTANIMNLRNECQARNIDWRCWIVNLHNSSIGEKYPDVVVQNAWGDCYTSSLCVNNPDVHEYARSLLSDVIDTLEPSRVVMETACWMQAFHGRHHEFSLARMTPAIRYLLSICFCPACAKAAQSHNIDIVMIKRRTQSLLKQLIKEDTTFPGSEDAQMMQLFLEYPDLYAYQQFRMNSVKVIVSETANLAHQKGVLYEYIPSAAPFTINNMQYDASSFSALTNIVDGFVPLCYSANETYKLIKRNVHLYAANAQVSLALRLSSIEYSDREKFVAKIVEAVEEGAKDIYCYNYGLATEECLSWMSKAFCKIKDYQGGNYDSSQ